MKTLILHTGGTIGMAAAADGYRPMPGFPERLRQQLETRASTSQPNYDIVELPPIDSADLRPGHWPVIASTLLEHWHDYTGFVILHGTDTMAWSASALSFMLRGTDKPVIFTGAQIPLIETDSDALDNVEGALHFAANEPVREVGLYFGQRLLRGNRSRKLATTRFDAFDSPNYPPLAETGNTITLHRERIVSPGEKQFVIPEFNDQAVAILTLHPGISGATVDALTANPRVRGLILQTYGVGNAPQGDRELIAALERATARGITLLNTTQCLIGGVSQETYATGAALARIGVISAGDITLEAAFAKLHFLLASANDTDSVREGLQQSWCGEKS
ncbi:L-asparaginase 1 [Azonexus hydrophilus]|uniref:asparaginase n=1 Tax=Azonexus hydrophilus TaxID=418702 RepID=A0A1R1IBH8_9RHOO|nr:type I asparaginase [Azonexus hydrophilus]OMG56126.1 L-asparaginase 1 [Azonexus hydrophilus]